jgi:hypothetical protein
MSPWWKSAAAELLPGWLKGRRTPKPGPTIVRDASTTPLQAGFGRSDAGGERRGAPRADRTIQSSSSKEEP